MILYLHGFRSSPQSFKTSLMAQRMHALGMEAEYQCPQLPGSPKEAIALTMSIVEHTSPERLTLIGSSLGGYYACWLAEELGCRAVLLNPAVNAARDLAKHVGATTAYHTNAPFEFKHKYIGELETLAVEKITHPERYFLIAAKGDEVLDWREMIEHYRGAQQLVIDGSDHGLSDFKQYMDCVLEFCGVDLRLS